MLCVAYHGKLERAQVLSVPMEWRRRLKQYFATPEGPMEPAVITPGLRRETERKGELASWQ